MKRTLFRAVAIVIFSTFSACAIVAKAAPSPPVQIKEDSAQIVLENGLVGITVAKATGIVTSIRTRRNGQDIEFGNGSRAMLYDFDNHSHQHVNFGQTGATVRLLNHTAGAADISVASEPTDACPFRTEFHWILRRGDSGFYTYIVYHHTKGMPACTWEQTRAVIRAARGTDLFTNYVVDDKRTGPFPTGPVLRTVFDTTWLYASDPEPRSKYETTNFIGDDLVHGLAGHGVGLWMIAPSREYVNGGPLRQELTSHQDSPTSPPQNNILLWMLQGNHFGGPNMEIAADEEWARFYGPAMVYVNQAPTTEALWADAKKKALAEDAKWPYAFVQSADYPLQRGTVRGQIQLTGGGRVGGAWVVLAAPGDQDWCMSSHGYEFWTKAGADGRFILPKVRPGRYTLFATGGNQFDDFRRDNIKVVAGSNDLGTLAWTPVTHGRMLWQIGQPDRSTQEFAHGQDVRHYTNYLRYGTQFPSDVTFVIGSSQERRDWNFAQWGWYARQPYWTVRFQEPEALHGAATLTLALASFDYPRGLQVRLAGREIGVVRLPKSGMAPYRCGGQDSLRQTVSLTFDAGLIQRGVNELQLALIGAVPFDPKSSATPSEIGAVMYDALRLEVDPDQKSENRGSSALFYR